MVFDYMEYDLTGILETKEINLTQDHIKSWARQLLSGTYYMHKNQVIHRDLKASNILINNKGELKIADWGLARSWSRQMRLTTRVITLWYRPPELLLGCRTYTPKIDMWSVGCIVAEMFRRSGFLKGRDEPMQLDLIFNTCGHPTKEDWPEIDSQCRHWKNYKPDANKVRPNRLKEALLYKNPHPKWMTPEAIGLVSKLLTLNPDKRLSAKDAMLQDYFFVDPKVKAARDLAMNFNVSSAHELDIKRRHEEMMKKKNRN